MDNIALLILGIFISVIGIVNMTGNMKRVAHHIHQARQYLRQATLNGWCNEKSEPHNRQDAEYGENDGGLSVVISIHDRSSPFFPLP